MQKKNYNELLKQCWIKTPTIEQKPPKKQKVLFPPANILNYHKRSIMELMTHQEASDLLGVSKKTIYQLIWKGVLKKVDSKVTLESVNNYKNRKKVEIVEEVTVKEVKTVNDMGQILFDTKVDFELNQIKNMLLEKNRKYGNSALKPLRIFSRTDEVEQIKIRIDDKLSRMINQQNDEDEDIIQDLIGYFILLKIAQKSIK